MIDEDGPPSCDDLSGFNPLNSAARMLCLIIQDGDSFLPTILPQADPAYQSCSSKWLLDIILNDPNESQWIKDGGPRNKYNVDVWHSKPNHRIGRPGSSNDFMIGITPKLLKHKLSYSPFSTITYDPPSTQTEHNLSKISSVVFFSHISAINPTVNKRYITAMNQPGIVSESSTKFSIRMNLSGSVATQFSGRIWNRIPEKNHFLKDFFLANMLDWGIQKSSTKNSSKSFCLIGCTFQDLWFLRMISHISQPNTTIRLPSRFMDASSIAAKAGPTAHPGCFHTVSATKWLKPED